MGAHAAAFVLVYAGYARMCACMFMCMQSCLHKH